MRETPVVIDGPVGQLEALYLDSEAPRGLALICHPNPVQGGTMLNKVVSTLQRTARDAGLVTLRFNYRGVGASAGSHDMGTGEVDDAQAAADWLREKYPQLPLTLFGFSFGGFVAASLGGRLEAQGQPPKHLFMVAPAVMRLIGFDPGPRTTGWGVVEVSGSRLRHVANGLVTKTNTQDRFTGSVFFNQGQQLSRLRWNSGAR